MRSVGVGGVDGVETDEGVDVDQFAGLVFGDFGKGQPQRDAVGFGEVAQVAVGGDGGASPQFRSSTPRASCSMVKRYMASIA